MLFVSANLTSYCSIIRSLNARNELLLHLKQTFKTVSHVSLFTRTHIHARRHAGTSHTVNMCPPLKLPCSLFSLFISLSLSLALSLSHSLALSRSLSLSLSHSPYLSLSLSMLSLYALSLSLSENCIVRQRREDTHYNGIDVHSKTIQYL